MSNDRSLDGKINWEGVPVAQRQWAESQGSLTQTGAAVMTVVASVLSWGYGADLVGAAQGSWTGAAANAGLSALASNAAVSLINNNGDIGATLRELGSSRTIKDILSAMATAGAVQGLNIGLGIQGWNASGAAAGTATWSQVLARNLLNGATAGIVGAAINGTSVEDAIKNGLLNGLLNTAASGSAQWIGGNAQGFSNAVAHAIAGCLVGAGRAGAGYGVSAGDGCSAGAIGATVGHLTGQFYNPTDNSDLAAQTIQLGQLMAGIAGALVGGNQASADIATAAGGNAVENNTFGQVARAVGTICARFPVACVGAAGAAALQAQMSARVSELQAANPGLSVDNAVMVAQSEIVARALVNTAISFVSNIPSAADYGNGGYGADGIPYYGPPNTGNTNPAPITFYDPETGGYQVGTPITAGNLVGGGYGASNPVAGNTSTTTPNNGPAGGSLMMSQGTWVSVNESMSDRARDYQTQITGASGRAYVVNGVKFDGVAWDGTLLDAKGPGYGSYVLPNGEFAPWFAGGAQSLLDQADRQSRAAQGTAINWMVADQPAVVAIQNLLNRNGFGDIKVIYIPPK